MKPERKRELEEEAKNRTKEDEDLFHIIYTHLIDGFYHFAIAEAEANSVDDDRAREIKQVLAESREQLEEVIERVVDTIPGVMGKEEATKEMQQQQLKQFIDYAIKPGDPLDGEEEDSPDFEL